MHSSDCFVHKQSFGDAASTVERCPIADRSPQDSQWPPYCRPRTKSEVFRSTSQSLPISVSDDENESMDTDFSRQSQFLQPHQRQSGSETVDSNSTVEEEKSSPLAELIQAFEQLGRSPFFSDILAVTGSCTLHDDKSKGVRVVQEQLSTDYQDTNRDFVEYDRVEQSSNLLRKARCKRAKSVTVPSAKADPEVGVEELYLSPFKRCVSTHPSRRRAMTSPNLPSQSFFDDSRPGQKAKRPAQQRSREDSLTRLQTRRPASLRIDSLPRNTFLQAFDFVEDKLATEYPTESLHAISRQCYKGVESADLDILLPVKLDGLLATGLLVATAYPTAPHSKPDAEEEPLRSPNHPFRTQKTDQEGSAPLISLLVPPYSHEEHECPSVEQCEVPSDRPSVRHDDHPTPLRSGCMATPLRRIPSETLMFESDGEESTISDDILTAPPALGYGWHRGRRNGLGAHDMTAPRQEQKGQKKLVKLTFRNASGVKRYASASATLSTFRKAIVSSVSPVEASGKTSKHKKVSHPVRSPYPDTYIEAGLPNTSRASGSPPPTQRRPSTLQKRPRRLMSGSKVSSTPAESKLESPCPTDVHLTLTPSTSSRLRSLGSLFASRFSSPGPGNICESDKARQCFPRNSDQKKTWENDAYVSALQSKQRKQVKTQTNIGLGVSFDAHQTSCGASSTAPSWPITSSPAVEQHPRHLLNLSSTALRTNNDAISPMIASTVMTML